ncbi:hypothetical protein BASA83_010805 [Batrachochytrium salamandrivorans]|nr:hypothetical protein BASA83_010805 [Batrachochytrium salamandrivorans]
MNAVVLALIDAGIPLRITCASTTCMINQDGTLLLDPVSMEVSEAQSIHTLMFDTTTSEVMGIDSTGLFDTEEFDSCYELSKLAASSIHSFMRAAIERKIKKEQGVDSQ